MSLCISLRDLTHVPTQHHSRLPKASENRAHSFIDCKVPVSEELKKRKAPLNCRLLRAITRGCGSDHSCKWYLPSAGTMCSFPGCPGTAMHTLQVLGSQSYGWQLSFPYLCGELPGCHGVTGQYCPNTQHNPGLVPPPGVKGRWQVCLVACQPRAPSAGPGLISGQSCRHGRSHPAGSPGAPPPGG